MIIEKIIYSCKFDNFDFILLKIYDNQELSKE